MARIEGPLLQDLHFHLRDGTYTTISNFDTSPGKSFARTFTGMQPSYAPVIQSPHKLATSKIDNAKTDKPKSIEMIYLCYNLDSSVYIYKFNGRPPYYANHVDKKLITSEPVCLAASTEAQQYSQLEMLVATKTGTIINYNPFSRTCVYYNEDHSIEGSKETRPTHIAWVPQHLCRFAVSFTSGILLVFTTKYKVPGVPQSNPTIDTCHFAYYPARTKKTVLKMKLRVGADTLNHFAFSSDGKQIATASSDGFLRLFTLKPIQLCGRARSNFGGVLCVCWSPDEKLLATGTEDDMVTIWGRYSLMPLARCYGHRSWVNSVMFDPHYIPSLPEELPAENALLSPRRERIPSPDDRLSKPPLCRLQSLARVGSIYVESIIPTYRIGSAGQDGKMFIWEFSDSDLLPPPTNPFRPTLTSSATPPLNGASCMNGDPNRAFLNSASDPETDELVMESSNRKIKKPKDAKKPVKKRPKGSSSPLPARHDLQESQSYLTCSQVNRLEPVLEKFICEDRLTCIHFDKKLIVVTSHCNRIVCWDRPVKETTGDNESLGNHVTSKSTAADS